MVMKLKQIFLLLFFVLIQHYQSLNVLKWPSCDLLSLQGPELVWPIYPSLEKFKKSKNRGCNKNPDQQSLGAAVRLVNQIKNWQKGQGALVWPLPGDPRLFYTRMNKMVRGQVSRIPWYGIMVLKPVGEALSQAIIRLKEYTNVRLIRLWKLEC